MSNFISDSFSLAKTKIKSVSPNKIMKRKIQSPDPRMRRIPAFSPLKT